MDRILQTLQSLLQLILQGLQQARSASFAAAVGSISPAFAGRRIAATTAPVIATRISAFAF